jgi:hypothetical protein
MRAALAFIVNFSSFASRLYIPFTSFLVFSSLLESTKGDPTSLAGGVLG